MMLAGSKGLGWAAGRRTPSIDETAGGDESLATVRTRRDGAWRLTRTAFRRLTIGRLVRGGRLADGFRLNRYTLVLVVGLPAIWLPALAYVRLAPVRYTSQFALILPGAGSSASINVAEIGQAVSSAPSAYSSSSLSPTVTYKTLIMSGSVQKNAAERLGIAPEVLGKPQVKLVAETALMQVELTGGTPAEALERVSALLHSFQVELERLRTDEISRRESATALTIGQYQRSAEEVRAKIGSLQASTGLNTVEQYNALVTSSEALRAKVAEMGATRRQQDEAIRSLAALLQITSLNAAVAMKLHADPEFSALAASTAKAAADLSELARQFGPNHPRLVDSRSRWVGARSRMVERGTRLTKLTHDELDREIDLSSNGQRPLLLSRLVSLVADRDGLAAELASLQEELGSTQARIRLLAETAAQLDRLNRDYKVAEAVFASALARVSTSKTDLFASYPMAQVIEAPSLPLKPSSPSKLIAFAGAGAGSLFLLVSLGLAWVRRPIIDKALTLCRRAHA